MEIYRTFQTLGGVADANCGHGNEVMKHLPSIVPTGRFFDQFFEVCNMRGLGPHAVPSAKSGGLS